jgi:hypothetical protein
MGALRVEMVLQKARGWQDMKFRLYDNGRQKISILTDAPARYGPLDQDRIAVLTCSLRQYWPAPLGCRAT